MTDSVNDKELIKDFMTYLAEHPMMMDYFINNRQACINYLRRTENPQTGKMVLEDETITALYRKFNNIFAAENEPNENIKRNQDEIVLNGGGDPQEGFQVQSRHDDLTDFFIKDSYIQKETLSKTNIDIYFNSKERGKSEAEFDSAQSNIPGVTTGIVYRVTSGGGGDNLIETLIKQTENQEEKLCILIGPDHPVELLSRPEGKVEKYAYLTGYAIADQNGGDLYLKFHERLPETEGTKHN